MLLWQLNKSCENEPMCACISFLEPEYWVFCGLI